LNIYEIYIEVFSEEIISLEDFLVNLRDGRYGKFDVEEIRNFRFQLENNVQQSAFVKGGELGLFEDEIEEIIREKIEEIRKSFLEVFGWL